MNQENCQDHSGPLTFNLKLDVEVAQVGALLDKTVCTITRATDDPDDPPPLPPLPISPDHGGGGFAISCQDVECLSTRSFGDWI